MNILRVASDLYPYTVGGLGIHVDQMSRCQAEMGHDVTVYTAKTDRPVNGYVANYKVCQFKPFVKIIGNSIMPNMFFSIIKEKRTYDIIHAHSHLFFSTNLCALVRKLGSPPLVVTNHGLRSQSAPDWVQEIYTGTGAKWTFDSADMILCYTNAERIELINIGIEPNKIRVIHNGVDTRLFVPEEKKKIPNKRLLWIGRFVRGKGVDYLIEAMRLLVKNYPYLYLVMVGNGPDQKKVQQKISDLALDHNIKILDNMPNSDIVKLYQNADIFVLPSIEEGVPRTILEAMSCGLPIVCTKLPQLVSIVKCCGLLVPSKDAKTLADKISEILSDDELAGKLGENGRKNVIVNYSWKDTVEKTTMLYEELIKCRK